MAKRKRKNVPWKIGCPKLNASDFDIDGYQCLIIRPQEDNRLVGVYATEAPDNLHYLVIVGEKRVRLNCFADVCDYCRRMHYDIGVGS